MSKSVELREMGFRFDGINSAQELEHNWNNIVKGGGDIVAKTSQWIESHKGQFTQNDVSSLLTIKSKLLGLQVSPKSNLIKMIASICFKHVAHSLMPSRLHNVNPFNELGIIYTNVFRFLKISHLFSKSSSDELLYIYNCLEQIEDKKRLDLLRVFSEISPAKRDFKAVENYLRLYAVCVKDEEQNSDFLNILDEYHYDFDVMLKDEHVIALTLPLLKNCSDRSGNTTQIRDFIRAIPSESREDIVVKTGEVSRILKNVNESCIGSFLVVIRFMAQRNEVVDLVGKALPIFKLAEQNAQYAALLVAISDIQADDRADTIEKSKELLKYFSVRSFVADILYGMFAIPKDQRPNVVKNLLDLLRGEDCVDGISLRNMMEALVEIPKSERESVVNKALRENDLTKKLEILKAASN